MSNRTHHSSHKHHSSHHSSSNSHRGRKEYGRSDDRSKDYGKSHSKDYGRPYDQPKEYGYRAKEYGRSDDHADYSNPRGSYRPRGYINQGHNSHHFNKRGGGGGGGYQQNNNGYRGRGRGGGKPWVPRPVQDQAAAQRLKEYMAIPREQRESTFPRELSPAKPYSHRGDRKRSHSREGSYERSAKRHRSRSPPTRSHRRGASLSPSLSSSRRSSVSREDRRSRSRSPPSRPSSRDSSVSRKSRSRSRSPKRYSKKKAAAVRESSPAKSRRDDHSESKSPARESTHPRQPSPRSARSSASRSSSSSRSSRSSSSSSSRDSSVSRPATPLTAPAEVAVAPEVTVPVKAAVPEETTAEIVKEATVPEDTVEVTVPEEEPESPKIDDEKEVDLYKMDTSSVSSTLHDSGMEEGEVLSGSEGSEGSGSPLLVDDDVIRSASTVTGSAAFSTSTAADLPQKPTGLKIPILGSRSISIGENAGSRYPALRISFSTVAKPEIKRNESTSILSSISAAATEPQEEYCTICTNTHVPSAACSFDGSANKSMDTETRCTTPPPLPTLAPFSWADAHKATEEAAAKVRAEAEAREAEKRAALARKLAFLAEESEIPDRCVSCPPSPSPQDHPELDERPGSALGLVTWIDILREEQEEEARMRAVWEAKMAAQLMEDSCSVPAQEPISSLETVEMEVDLKEDSTACTKAAPMQPQDPRSRKKTAAQCAIQKTSPSKAVNEAFMKRTAADLEAAETLILLSRSPSPVVEAKPQFVNEIDPIARVMMALGGSAALFEKEKKKTPEEAAMDAAIMAEISAALGELSDETVHAPPMETPKTSQEAVKQKEMDSERLKKTSKNCHEAVTVDPPSIATECLSEVAPTSQTSNEEAKEVVATTQETSLEFVEERKELETYLCSTPPSKPVETVQLPETTAVEEKMEKVPPPHPSKTSETAKKTPVVKAVVNVEKKKQESQNDQIQVLVDDDGVPIGEAAEEEEEPEHDRAEQENRFEKWLKLQEEHEGDEEQQTQDLREMALRLLALASLKEAVAERKKREAAAEADEEDEDIIVD